MKLKVLVNTAILCLFCCGTAMAQWPHNTYGNHTNWEMEIGTRILDREGTELGLSLVTEFPTLRTVFNSNDGTDLDSSAGADIRVMKNTGYDAMWEVRSFFNNWENFESRTGDLRAPLFTPATLPPLSHPDRFDYTYESDMFGFEVNYKRTVQPGLTCLIGPRFMSLSEQVTIDSNFVNPLPGFEAFSFDLNSITKTENYMPGIGFGLEVRRPLLRELFFVGTVKGSLLANFTSAETIVTGTVAGGLPTRTTVFSDNKTTAAGVGEFSARLHWDIAPGTISLYSGFEAMWVDGATLAPAQVLANITPPISINSDNTTFIHGIVFGTLIRY